MESYFERNESYFPSSRNVFLNESSNPMVEAFLIGGETLFQLAEREFLSSEKMFSFISYFFPASQNGYLN